MGVSIYESAIKPSVDLEDSVNVYVPGYSSIGPEEPTLCNSVSEFEGLFGSSPYLFESAQFSGANAIAIGSPEKGYLYAKALLNAGLKVLFHRVKPANAATASVDIAVEYGTEGEYTLVAQAISFGKSYNNVKVTLSPVTTTDQKLYKVTIKDASGSDVAKDVLVSLDPTSSIYIKLVNLPLIQFKAKVNDVIVDIEDSIMMTICKADTVTIASTEFTLAGGGPDTNEFSAENLLSGLADRSLLKPLLDFERYPSVTYLTSGGYYVNSGSADAAAGLIEYADTIKAVSLIDYAAASQVKDSSSWNTYQASLAGLTGTPTAKGKSATFIGCNSFNLSPYRVVLGDSLNYLVALGNNLKNNIKPWIPVANDPNGVAGIGYDTTNKITTDLAETISEGNIGVSANAIIYSKSAGGYKIMGNRTLRSNDGVLSPNSFLNIAVIVNRVERSCRQTANKLKIVSTNPRETFNKFEESVSKTIQPMVVNQDGVLSYKMRMLPKTKPATIDIEIHLVVLEGIEQFNIYIPYELSLD